MSRKQGCGPLWATPQARDFKNPGSLTGKRAQRKRSQGWTTDLNDQVVQWSQDYVREMGGNKG
jgi:hypothetical protein